MRRKLIWPGLLIAMIATLVIVDVTMLVIATSTELYTVVPTDEAREQNHHAEEPTP